MSNIRRLTCTCCGGDAGRHQQYWNQDTGYGMCHPCILWVRSRGMSEAEIERTYGKEGVNWGKEDSHE